MKYILILILAVTVYSCNDYRRVKEKSETKQPVNTDSPAPVAEADVDGCYMKVTGRDTAILMLERKGNELSGKMIYDNYQKDGSRGTVKGTEKEDILKLYYDFNSEGMHSVIEVYFKKVTGGLLRGIGSMEVKGDTAYFVSGINYSYKEAFSLVECSEVKEKFNDL